MGGLGMRPGGGWTGNEAGWWVGLERGLCVRWSIVERSLFLLVFL